jgi:hypothetical protein
MMLATACLASTAGAQLTTVRVEIDYMIGLGSHKPSPATLGAVQDMFACHGINLIIDLDDEIGFWPMVECEPVGSANFFTGPGVASFATLRDLFRDQGDGWHYCIFGDRYDDGQGDLSSGVAEMLGNDMFVADGALAPGPVRSYLRAATFAHVLGHNLGLEHFAPSNIYDDPFSPNLPSVMSLQYQLRGVKTRLECLGLVGNDHRFKDLDYSHGRLPYLQESVLRESLGVGIRAVDWDCNGSATNFVSKSLSTTYNWCAAGPGTDIVHDYDEWAVLDDRTSEPTVLSETPLSYETCAKMESTFGGPGECSGVGAPIFPSTGVAEGCVAGQMYFIDPLYTGFQQGTGSLPFKNASISAFLPDGSVVYLQPGVHTSASGGAIVLDRPLVLDGPGGAVIAP